MAKVLVDSCVFVNAFDPNSHTHIESLALLEYLRAKGRAITMPAHAWFEVQCSLQKLTEEGRFVGPAFEGQMNYPIELIHIDKEFILRYRMADIPYIKAGDHIFLAIAKLDGLPLITSDEKMISVARQCGVKVFHTKELVESAVDST